MSAPVLRWHGAGSSWTGDAGGSCVAAVMPAGTPAEPGRAVWGCMGATGHADTPDAAKAAAHDAWAAWCTRAGLVPAPAGDAPDAGWQPIETARPGREDATFLVWCPGLDVSGPWVVAYRQAGEWIAALTGHPLPVEPTHWMPLPSAPEAPGESKVSPYKSAGGEVPDAASPGRAERVAAGALMALAAPVLRAEVAGGTGRDTGAGDAERAVAAILAPALRELAWMIRPGVGAPADPVRWLHGPADALDARGVTP